MVLMILLIAPFTSVYPDIESFLIVFLKMNFDWYRYYSPSPQFATYFLKDTLVQLHP